MRWIFPDARDAQESHDRQIKVGQIDAWWTEFAKRTDDLDSLFSRKSKWDLPAWMQRHLGAVSESLMWEFGPSDVGHRLAITPEHKKHLRPLVHEILRRAPKLPRWRFIGGRPPESVDMTRQMVEAKSRAPFAAAEVCVQRGAANSIDLAFLMPKSADDQLAMTQSFYAAESLLGEEILDKWIGVIEPVRKKEKGYWVPLDRLHATVEASISSIRDQMSPNPIPARSEKAEYVSLQLKPDGVGQRADCPGRSDMLVATTRLLEPWRYFHEGRNFYSERFSRCNERFCYVKIDYRSWPRQQIVEFRGRIEDSLEPVLESRALGTTTGGGTGWMYTYIDLVLHDVNQAIPAIRDACRMAKAPRRSWLLFFDCEWRDEWVGIWDETPAPPSEEDDSIPTVEPYTED